MQPDVTSAIDDLDTTLTTIEKVLDLDELDSRSRELEEQAADPSLWDDPEHAQQVTSQLSHVQARLKKVRGLRSRLDDLPVMYEMADEAGAENAAEGAEAKELADAELDELKTDIESLEVTTMLSGEYDQREAVVNIRSAAGGVDAADWAEMLMRMYIRWAEKRGQKVEVYDISYAEEAGIKSATFVVHGDYMYGELSVEQGTHRLVRISPFDNQNRRQTSFASLEVMPELDNNIQIEINPADIEMQVYRSSGAGGQHINKTSSAVRLIHKPTGIVTSCQTQRSQLQNREYALEMMKAKLYQIALQQHKDKIDDIKGVQNEIAWGHQIRSYVFMPYTLVKDHRTNFESGNVQAVMDGDLDGFIYAYLKASSRGELQEV